MQTDRQTHRYADRQLEMHKITQLDMQTGSQLYMARQRGSQPASQMA